MLRTAVGGEKRMTRRRRARPVRAGAGGRGENARRRDVARARRVAPPDDYYARDTGATTVPARFPAPQKPCRRRRRRHRRRRPLQRLHAKKGWRPFTRYRPVRRYHTAWRCGRRPGAACGQNHEWTVVYVRMLCRAGGGRAATTAGASAALAIVIGRPRPQIDRRVWGRSPRAPSRRSSCVYLWRADGGDA